jgi:hypothetical protein
MSLRATLGLSWAFLAPAALFLAPFCLFGPLVNRMATLPVRPGPVVGGGPVARRIQRTGYWIQVHEPVARRRFQNAEAYVQVDWMPPEGLPAEVHEALDLGGDGRADLFVRFQVPADPRAPLAAEVTCLRARVPAGGIRRQSFTCCILRTEDRILLRLPLARGERP